MLGGEVGEDVGPSVGRLDGSVVGTNDGNADGAIVGRGVGTSVGKGLGGRVYSTTIVEESISEVAVAFASTVMLTVEFDARVVSVDVKFPLDAAD